MIRLELLVYSDQPLRLAGQHPGGLVLTPCAEPPRLADDTQLHGASAALVARIEAAPCALRMTVRRDEGALESAQRDAAEALQQLVPAAEIGNKSAEPDVLDVFCLDARPLGRAVERLRSSRPEATMWAGTRPRADGLFDVETFGLRKLEHREVHVPAVPPESVAPVVRFLNKIADYTATTGRMIQPGDVTSFGWVDVKHVPAERLAGYPGEPARCAPPFLQRALDSDPALPGVLVVFEPADDSRQPAYRPGASRAANIVSQMLETARLCGVEESSDIPRAHQTAIVCRRAREGITVKGRRVVPETIDESGWVVVCSDPSHDHALAESFEQVLLRDLAQRISKIFGLLAMPSGSAFTLQDSGELTIYPP